MFFEQKAPHFAIFWAQNIPKVIATGTEGRTTDVAVITGRLNGPNASVDAPLLPSPDSWAAQLEADVAIWTLRMAPALVQRCPEIRQAFADDQRTQFGWLTKARRSAEQRPEPCATALDPGLSFTN